MSEGVDEGVDEQDGRRPEGERTAAAGVTPLPVAASADITAGDTPSGVITAPERPPAEVAAGPSSPDRRAPRRRRRRRPLLWTTVAVVVLLLIGGGLVAAHRIEQPLGRPTLRTSLADSQVVAGTEPSLPWPSTGQAAVAVPALGYTAQSGPESSVPIASLTKMTNALVILHDHPLATTEDGPAITITSVDVAEYDDELHMDESTIPIRVGEVLTERQMLEAMLTQSANDVAYSLALWDAGSLPAFVAKMNAMAASLGATGTHYVDASGYNPGSVSTAADCLRVAAAGMAIPAFAQVVGMSSVTLPLVGTLPNIVTEIGSDHVVGVKSGYTSEAKGCMVLAAEQTVDGRTVLVLVAVLGQPVPAAVAPPTTTTTTTAPKPTRAGGSGPTTTPTTTAPTTTTTTEPADDLEVPDPFRYTRPIIGALLAAAEGAPVRSTVATAGQPVGTVTATWGGTAHRVTVVTSQGAWLVGWPGQQVSASATLAPVPAGSRAGRTVGRADFHLGSQAETVPLTLSATVPEPTWWWRLVHN